MHSMLKTVIRGVTRTSTIGIADHRARGRFRLRVAVWLMGMGCTALVLDRACVHTLGRLADGSLARIGVDALQTVAHQLSLVGMLTGAPACVCGISELAANRAWCDRSKTVRALILMAALPLLIAAPVLLVAAVIG